MENRYIVNYDIKQRCITSIKFKQGDIDSSIIEVHLLDNGIAIDITGEVIEFRFLKPDMKVVYQDSTSGVSVIDAAKGSMQCILKSDTLAASGQEKCEIHRAKDGKELTTPYFYFTVEASIGADGILSTNYIGTIEGKLIVWQNAEDIRVAAENDRVTAEDSRVTAEDGRVTAEDSRVLAENGRNTAEDGRVTAETDRVNEFNVIKDNMTLFDVLPVATVRNSIELNPLGTYNYVSGNVVTANSLTTMENGQTDLNYAVALQVSNDKVYSKTSLGFDIDKMVRDINAMG